LRDKNAQISHDVEKVVLKALAKDVQQRYGSVQEFADALEHAYQQEVFRTIPLHSSNGSQPDTSLARATKFLTSGSGPLQQLMSRRRVMLALGGVALAGAVAGGVWLWNYLSWS
jgi:serine/threonine protein kinase